MRQFENKDFTYRLAEALDRKHALTIPDEEAKNALLYVQQFLYLTSGSSELLRGYISEDQLDALVRIRDESSSRDFGSAVEALGVDGGTSQDAGSDSEYTRIEVDADFKTPRTISKITRNSSSDISDKERTELYAIRDVVENASRQDVIMYNLPNDVFDTVTTLLDEKNLLL